MASEDISRSAFDATKRYRGVRMQQGRVLTDDDWNSGDDLAADDVRWTRIHVIGPAGSPDEGFRISNAAISGGSVDFELAAGTYYVSGHRVTLPQAIRYRQQPDWLDQALDDPPAPGAARTDFVYLEVWEQIVTAVEDEELFEKALGGPDTTTRRRLTARVRVLAGVSADDCEQAWQVLKGTLAGQHLGTLDPVGELVPDLKLQVTYADSGDPADLCAPAAAGGYLGAENQAIRVQLFDGQLAWGFDNAAPPYRATIDAAGSVVTLLTPPRDAVHWPLAGQTIEILRSAAELENGERLAALEGHLTTVSGSYNPNTGQVTLTVPHPDGAELARLGHVYVRMWRRGTDLASPATLPVVAGTPIPLGTTGITVTVTGTDLAASAWWVIAVRPETPDQVVPWALEGGRAPQGVRRFYAPIGMIFWRPPGAQVEDCRPTFAPLTAQRGCCRYTVGDGTTSHGQFHSIQDAIDALPASGGEICLLPGEWNENVVIEGRISVTVHGCAQSTVHPLDSGLATFSIRGSAGIRLEGFAIVNRENASVEVLGSARRGALPLGVVLHDLHLVARDRAAVVVLGVSGFELSDCRIEVEPLQTDLGTGDVGAWPAVYVQVRDATIARNRIQTRAGTRGPPDRVVIVGGQQTIPMRTARGGLQIAGQSRRVDVIGNLISGGLGNGITLGHVEWVVLADVQRAERGAEVEPVGEVTYTATPASFAASSTNAAASLVLVGPWLLGDCCPELDPNPPGPLDPDGGPLTPISGGDLADIRILDNEIAGMGANGIGVAWWWFEGGRNFDLVHVSKLTIEENNIHDCLWLRQRSLLADAARLSGWGGIALASASELEIRRNKLFNNGSRTEDPGCGVFALLVEHLVFEDNHLLGNGRPLTANDALTPGYRGGLVVSLAEIGVGAALQGSQLQVDDNRSAARVEGNRISSPDGPALWMNAVGPLSIHGNELGTLGRDAVVARALAKVNGVDPADRQSPYFAGLAVYLFEVGASTDLTDNLSTHTSPELESVALLSGGSVRFADNQVSLDVRAIEPALVSSSVLLLSLDDLLVSANHLQIRGDNKDQINANLVAWAPTLRVCDNRLTERLGSAQVSAYTYGGLNTTAGNQGTHCFLVVGIPSQRVDMPNTSWIDVYASSVCTQIRELGGSLSAKLEPGLPDSWRNWGGRKVGSQRARGPTPARAAEPQHTLVLLE